MFNSKHSVYQKLNKQTNKQKTRFIPVQAMGISPLIYIQLNTYEN